MTRIAAIVMVAVLYGLHQDVWFWREARPLVFGVLPVGLFYHAAYMVTTSLVLWALVTLVWPSHLEVGTAPTCEGEASASRDAGAFASLRRPAIKK